MADNASKICAKCHEQVVGERVTALGKCWHRNHFTCDACQTELVGSLFFEHEDKPYCQKDYHTLFAPKCATCKEAIVGKTVSAMGMTYHPDHFVCKACGKPFPEGRFRRKDNDAYCVEDFNNLFGVKCASCNEVIEGQYVTAMTKQWHIKCFACAVCKVPFDGEGFYERGALAYCKDHIDSVPQSGTTNNNAEDPDPVYSDVVFGKKKASQPQEPHGPIYDDPSDLERRRRVPAREPAAENPYETFRKPMGSLHADLEDIYDQTL